MNHDPVRRLFLLGMAAAGVGVAASAAAAEYPDRPIRMVVPYTPGGVADVFARLLGTIMAADLGQPFVIENKPGANTMVGAAAVAQAPADGYTVFQTTSTLMLNPLLYRRMPYDPKLLVPIAIGFEAPLVAVVSPRVPAKTMKEFVDYARSRPGKVNYASVGPGNVLHFVPELFKAQGGFEMTHIPYNGKSGEAFSSVLSGEVDFMSTVVAQALPSIQAGKVRALAVTSADRLPALPDVPTVAEAGFPDLKAATWYGLAVRSDTPPPVIARLVRAFDKALVDADFRKRFSDQGMVMQQPRSAAEVDAFARTEMQRWAVLINDQKIVLD